MSGRYSALFQQSHVAQAEKGQVCSNQSAHLLPNYDDKPIIINLLIKLKFHNFMNNEEKQ